MLTISQIRNGRNYMTRHLSANDYYAEGERVTGYWPGDGATKLGLSGDVSPEQVEALRSNRHPGTGERLTPRRGKVEFHDVTFSAPKSVSIAAIVGGDTRIVEAFRESTDFALKQLEQESMVRVRGGAMNQTESVRRTGNVIAAVFQHDSSRLLDPQLHAHMVLANASFDQASGRWLALQPRQMMEATRSRIRRLVHEDLASRIEKLGYQVRWDGENFRIRGIDRNLETLFSERAHQRVRFEQRYRDLFGSAPTKRRVEQFVKEGKSSATKRFKEEYRERLGVSASNQQVVAFVKDWRSSKLKEISTAEVRRWQQAKLTRTARQLLQTVIKAARTQTEQVSQSVVNPTAERNTSSLELQRPNEPNHSKERLIEKARDQMKSAAVVSRDAAKSVASKVASTVSAQLKSKPDKSVETAARRRVRVSRSEVLRRMHFGMQVQAACKGYHRGLVASRMRMALRR